MPGRSFTGTTQYRYGFNGQEKSVEINENLFTAECWEYDSRIGRRWNIDPVPKVFESPFSAFVNNPIRFIDPTGADTLDVKSKTFDVNGKQKGQKGFDPTQMLILFTVYSSEKTGLNDNNGNPTERRYSMYSNDFNGQYSITPGSATGYTDGEMSSRKPASILSINTNSPFFFNSVIKVDIASIESLRKEVINVLKGRWYSPLNIDKLKYFNGGKTYDIKAQLLKGFTYSYINGVGLVESDFVGNVFYGSVMSNFQSLSSSLHDGDFLQKTGVDDVYDSYAIIAGYKFGKVAITSSTFQSVNNIILTKWSTTGGRFQHQYEIQVKKEDGWKTQNINTSNY